MARQVVHIEGVTHGHTHGMPHGGPVPLAVMKGNILMSSGVTSADPVKGGQPDDMTEKFRAIFKKIGDICAAAGGSLDDVIKITFYIPDRALVHNELDAVWSETFGGYESSPARYVIIINEKLYHADFTAVIGSDT